MNYYHLIKEVLLSAIGNVLYLVAFLLPKNKDLWIFGGLLGEGYNDNSKYFFEFVNKHKEHITAVWLTQNPNVVKELKTKGFRVYHGYSLKGILTAMQASVAVISHSKVRDLKPFVINSNVKFIQLWHGIPLKKIEYDDNVFFYKPNITSQLGFLLMKLISPGFRRKPDMMIAASKEDRTNFSSAFQIDKNKIRITGYPRNDMLKQNSCIQKKTGLEKTILYVPTFRGQEKSHFDLFERYDFDFQAVDSFLKEQNIQFYIKLHPYNIPSKKLLKYIERTQNMVFYDGPDIYDCLSSFDILITDYSSIYFDFLLLDRPIIFTSFDLKHYLKNDREFYYSYNDVTPGPKAMDWGEALDCIRTYIENPMLYRDARRAMLKRFHSFRDSEASKRVFNEITKLL